MNPRMRRCLGTATMVLALTMVAGVALAGLPPGGTFIDDDGNIHEPYIEAIAAAGYTTGCNPPVNDRFCPAQLVTRAEMATFLIRMKNEGANLPPYRGFFTDVPSGQWYTGFVERAFEIGLTDGYGDGTYRPLADVSRAETAAHLVAALGESLPTVHHGYFSDVPAGAWYAPYVERLYELGITTGCATNPARYCPDTSLPRDEMATLLAKAAGLSPIVPPTTIITTPTSDTTVTIPPPL